MSRKKISTSVGISADVFERLKKDAEKERRSKSFIVEEALRNYYKMPEGEKGEKVNAE